MEKKHKDLLTSKRVFLVDNLDMEELYDHMIQTRLLSDNDMELLKSKITKTGMAREFLSSMLPRRGPKAYSRFIQALMSTEAQEFIAEELDKELPSDYTDSTGSVPRSVKSDEDIIKEVKASASIYQTVQSTTPGFVKSLTQVCYPMSRRVRGRAVIIINMFFCNYEMREPEGCKNDIENLKTLLSAIHFQVELHENKNAQQIRDIVCAESDRDHSQFDAFILFALSHGKNNYIMGTDGEGVNIYKEICDLLGRCQSLKNKPKLLFFQACRGDESPPSQTASPEGKKSASPANSPPSETASSKGKKAPGTADSLPSETASSEEKKAASTADNYADFLISYATIPGFPAHRHEYKGSWFVRYFVYVCSSEAHCSDLNHIMIKVNRLVKQHLGKKQVSEFVVRLERDVYFLPGYFQPLST